MKSFYCYGIYAGRQHTLMQIGRTIRAKNKLQAVEKFLMGYKGIFITYEVSET